MASRTEEQWEQHIFPLESKLQEYVLKRLKGVEGIKVFKIHGGRFQVGVPDLLLCVKGRFVAIELKKNDKEKATPLQVLNLKEIIHAHGFAEVCWTWGQVKDLIKRVDQDIKF